MKKIKLSKAERAIEKALVGGEYRPTSQAEFNRIVSAIARRKKDAVLSLRVNSKDLNNIKKKALKLGVPYQTLITELIHKFAA